MENIEYNPSDTKVEYDGENTYSAEYSLCRNIDESLGAFEFEEMLDSRETNYDWILDGSRDYAHHAARTDELLKMLNAPDIETELELESSRIERRQLQFACFVESVQEASEDSCDDSEEVVITSEEFGHFQEPKTIVDKDEQSDTIEKPEISLNAHSCKSETYDSNYNFIEEKKECEKINVPYLFSEMPDEKISVPVEIQTDITAPEDDEVQDTDLFSDSDIDCESTSSIDASLQKINIDTLEGRYLQRQRTLTNECKQPLSLKLPQHFYEDTCEDAECEIIRSLPWRNFPLFKHRGNVDLEQIEHHLMSRLMQHDEWLLEVNNLLFTQISQRKSSLDLCNQYLRDFDHNLNLADMKLCQSVESIKKAKGGEEEDCFAGLIGGFLLLEAWDQRTIYNELDNCLLKCTELIDQEKSLQKRIDDFSADTKKYPDIINAAKKFSLNAHEDERLSKIVALEGLRGRADRVLDTFAEKVQQVLQWYVRKGCLSWDHFSQEIYLDLFQAMVSIEKEQGNDVSTVPATWITCIMDSLQFEAEKCLALALLDPTNAKDSKQDKELVHLAYALQQINGDFSKMKHIINNLTEIRYGNEAAHNYFPFVYHRLCFLLTQVLHCHLLHEEWHAADAKDCKEISKEVHTLLLESRVSLWNRCEQTIISALEGYTNFASKKKLFDQNSDDKLWKDDLEGIHAVLRLSQQFYALGQDFINRKNEQLTALDESQNKNSLHSAICTLMRKHLRQVHVETMNTMGISLSKESWYFVPMETLQGNNSRSFAFEADFKSCLLEMIKSRFDITSSVPKLWNNQFISSKHGWLSKMKDFGNPFELLHSIEDNHDAFEDFDWTIFEVVDVENSASRSASLFDLMLSVMKESKAQESRISIASCFEVYTKSLARLLVIMGKFALILPDVTKVVMNVSDLYVTTVFRLCVGNSANEKYVLGLESPKLFTMEALVKPNKSTNTRKNSGPAVGFGRRNSSVQNKNGRPPQVISPTIESEVCFPLPSEMDYIMPLQKFILRAQKDLEGMVKLDMVEGWLHDPDKISPDESEEEFLCNVCVALEKRYSAAWSCLSVAATLDVMKSLSKQVLKKEALSHMFSMPGIERFESSKLENDLSNMIIYADSFLEIIPRFIRMSNRMACIRAIGTRRIIEEIGRCHWNTSRLSESSNQYVELVCGRYAFIWRFLCTSAKLPIGLREETWRQLVIVGYATLLEGFARVPHCTTEGRSLMSMDLASFATGISPPAIEERLHYDGTPQPRQVVSSRGREHVDKYIKASYYPEEDVLNWIDSNKTTYYLNHSLALTNGRSDLLEKVKTLYKTEDDACESAQDGKTAQAET